MAHDNKRFASHSKHLSNKLLRDLCALAASQSIQCALIYHHIETAISELHTRGIHHLIHKVLALAHSYDIHPVNNDLRDVNRNNVCVASIVHLLR
jgi:hypothetical protein